MSEELLHYGVKGMRWGVRKKQDSSTSQNDNKPKNSVTSRIKEELGSLKRERSWKKELKNLDNMSIADMNKLTNRIRLENDLQRLSKKSKVATKEDKQNYRRRGEMSDKQLQDTVNLLRTKDNLSRAVIDASKDQMEFGRRAVRTLGASTLTYATTGKLSTKDIGMAVLNSTDDKYRERRKKIVREVINKTDTTVLGSRG